MMKEDPVPAARRFNISILFLLLLLAALGAGFFLTIHTIDLFRLEQESTVREIRYIRTELGRVQASFEQLFYAVGTNEEPPRRYE